jgi:pyruvate ferredoxin oxidoreductase beta subunit
MVKQIKNLKEFSTSNDRFEGSNLMCPGCAHNIIVREVLNATDDPIIVATATGCLEVCTAVYPHTSWDVSWMHIGFENAATAIAGVEAMHKARKRKGLIPEGQRDPKFVAFGGDGATYDIGFQWLSGAVERGHDFMYVCLDNEVYANTGGQRSSSTPLGASTTTSPAGRVSYGEKKMKKSMMEIMSAHGAPYVAQVAPNKWKDMVKKVQRGFETEGPVYINAMSACTTEWKFAPEDTIAVSDLGIDSCVWPLYEIINDIDDDGVIVDTKLNITYRPKNKIPVREYLEAQPRFRHLFKGDHEDVIKTWQKLVDSRWELLQRREEANV